MRAQSSEERAWASTMLDTGITVGSLVALPCSGALAAACGWRGTLCIYAALTAAFAVAWARYAAASPAECAYCSGAELELLRDRVKAGDAPSASPSKRRQVLAAPTAAKECAQPLAALLPRVLASAALWSLFAAHSAFNFGIYFATSWSPSFYQQELGVRPERAGLALTLPPLLNCLVKALLNKPIEAALRARGASTLQCRRAFSVAGFVGGALALLALPHAARAYGLPGATVAFSLVFGFAALHPSGFKANYLDVARGVRGSGFCSGLGNTLASLASFLSPLVVGRLLSTSESWAPVFGAIAATNLAAAAAFGALSTTTPID